MSKRSDIRIAYIAIQKGARLNQPCKVCSRSEVGLYARDYSATRNQVISE